MMEKRALHPLAKQVLKSTGTYGGVGGGLGGLYGALREKGEGESRLGAILGSAGRGAMLGGGLGLGAGLGSIATKHGRKMAEIIAKFKDDPDKLMEALMDYSLKDPNIGGRAVKHLGAVAGGTIGGGIAGSQLGKAILPPAPEAEDEEEWEYY